MRLALFFTICIPLLVSGCSRDDQIQTYRVPKESAPTLPMMGLSNSASQAAGAIHWKTPAGWTEQAPSAMRVGSFLIKGSNGQTADVSIIPLGGMAGGDLANINRWRGQIGLEPLNDLTGQSQTINPGGRPMRLVDFVSHEPMIDNHYRKRLIAAIYTRGRETWFFKMMGEDQTVEAAKPTFLTFLQHLQFHGE